MSEEIYRKYFILNKKSDFLRGFLSGFTPIGRGVEKKGKDVLGAGMLSRVFDGGEKGMVWHRLKFECKGSSPSGRIVLFASEKDRIYYDDELWPVDDLIKNPKLYFSEKIDALSGAIMNEYPFCDDILLHDIKGRYMWFYIEIYPSQEEVFLSDFYIYFPRESWIDSLPEIYSKGDSDSFLERYLGIFESIYEDMEDRIYDVPNRIDVDRTRDEYLSWLASWLDLEEEYRWSPRKLRALIKKGFELYRKRGTRESVLEFVELYTGERPIIAEWSHYKDIKHNEKLYSNDPYTYTIFVREEVVHSEKMRRTLARIIEDVTPAHMNFELVILLPYVFLDNHSYIGINSRIGKYKQGMLDGRLALSFSTLR